MTSVLPTSLREIFSYNEDTSRAILEHIRWNGSVSCPVCQSSNPYPISSRRKYKCRVCDQQFSVLSNSEFGSSKLKPSDILAAAFVFSRARNGISSCNLANTLGVQQRTAWSICNRFRAGLQREVMSQSLSGIVEIDGAIFGGHTRIVPGVGFRGKSDDGLRVRHYGNRRTIVVAKQRAGRTLPILVAKEADAKPDLERYLDTSTTIVADGSRAWDGLLRLFEMIRLEHAWTFKIGDACTNNAESFFANMRKMHGGTHGHMSHRYMHRYACELAWKRDHNEMKIDKDEQFWMIVKLALTPGVLLDWDLVEELYGEGATTGEIGTFLNVPAPKLQAARQERIKAQRMGR